MKVRTVFLILPYLMSWACAASYEMLDNGNFADGFSHWELVRNDGYGTAAEVQIVDGVLVAENLKKVKTWHLVLRQPVNIRQGVQYQLRFELKGEAEGQIRFGVGHPQKKGHLWTNPIAPPSSWKSVELEFSGQYDTDPWWFQDRKEVFAANEINSALRTKIPKKYPKGDAPDDPSSYSVLSIGIGDLTGDLMLRNFSLVELAAPAGEDQ